MKRTFSVFREMHVCSFDEGYQIVHGIPLKVEWSDWDDGYWMVFRSREDYKRLYSHYIMGI